MSTGTETHRKTCGTLVKDDQPPECPFCGEPLGSESFFHQECLKRREEKTQAAEKLAWHKRTAESYERAQLVAEQMEQRWEPVDALLKQHERIMPRWMIGAGLATALASAFADGKFITALAMVILIYLIFVLTDSVFKLLRSVLGALDEIIQKQNDVSATTVLYVRNHKDEADKFIREYYEQAKN